MPFRITSSQKEFQLRPSNLLDVIMDDILIHSKTDEEHDTSLDIALKSIEASGRKLNKAKSESLNSCTFRHVISSKEITSHPNKVQAIENLLRSPRMSPNSAQHLV